MFKIIRDDLAAAFGRDPAVRNRLEVALCYPGFHAIVFFRIGHWFWCRRMKLVGRFVTHVGRFISGVEIHPGATIGRGLFIDHGMGVVIGETAEIGDNVTLYQGVTLGGTSWNTGKRHPTLGDNVVVGAGAKVLGPINVGTCAAVGSNAVVVKDVPEGSTIVGIPGRILERGDERERIFAAYGVSSSDMPDPVSKALNGLLDHITKLETRVTELEGERLTGEAQGIGTVHDTGDEDRAATV